MMGAIQAWIEATMTAAEKMRRACCCILWHGLLIPGTKQPRHDWGSNSECTPYSVHTIINHILLRSTYMAFRG